MRASEWWLKRCIVASSDIRQRLLVVELWLVFDISYIHYSYFKMYGTSEKPSRYVPNNNFQKVNMMELDEKVPLQAPGEISSTNPKKWLSNLSIGAFGGILSATLILILSSGANIPLETSTTSDSVEYCSGNNDFSKLTLKPLLDQPVFSLLKPKNLKG